MVADVEGKPECSVQEKRVCRRGNVRGRVLLGGGAAEHSLHLAVGVIGDLESKHFLGQVGRGSPL